MTIEVCMGCGRPLDECPRAECLDDVIDVVRLSCGCTSVNGQGHLPGHLKRSAKGEQVTDTAGSPDDLLRDCASPLRAHGSRCSRSSWRYTMSSPDQPTTAATDVPWALYEAMKRRVDQALHLIQSFDPTSGTDRARVFVDDLRHVLEGTGGD